MHCTQLAQLAAQLAFRADAIIALQTTIDSDAINHYWVHSRIRFDAWHRELANYRALEAADRPLAMQSWWYEQQGVLESIIVSDLLTRTFAALGAAIDRRHRRQELEPVTHAIFVTHLEIRNRVLQLLLFGRCGSIDQTVTLNRLRQAVERWTDHLLASIADIDAAALQYTFDAQRTLAFQQESKAFASPDHRTLVDGLAIAAMRASLSQRTSNTNVLAHANREIGTAVIGCLSGESFDGLGIPRQLILNPQLDTDLQASPKHPLFSLNLNEAPAGAVLPKPSRW